MKKIALLTDSCCGLLREQIAGKPIYVVPLTIHCSDGDYQDGVNINAAGVHQRLRTELPHTSLPLGSTVEAALRKILADGFERVIAITLSSGLSGTYNLFRLVAEQFPDLEIKTFDSLSGNMGYGGVILQICQYLEQGIPWEELLKRTERLIQGAHVFFSVDTLEYLYKGGRIGKITAVAGTMLNIKPILSFAPDGQLGSAAKVRGRKQIQDKLIDLVRELLRGVKHFDLMVANGGAMKEMLALAKRIKEACPGFRNFWAGEIDATLSIYTGPGVLGAGIVILDKAESSPPLPQKTAI